MIAGTTAYWMGTASEGGIIRAKDLTFGARVRALRIVQAEVAGVTSPFGDEAGQAMFEATLEMVRLRSHQRYPSRLTSLFLWPTARSAIRYANNAQYACVYKVSVTDVRGWFAGDYDVITYYQSPIMTFGDFLDRAERYWSTLAEGERVEWILDGEIRIERRISP